MREIQDKNLLEHYLEKYNIRNFFDTKELPFRMYEYAPGEMMNVLRPGDENLKFVVEGVFDLYTILDDGSPYLIHHCEGFGFLGDLDFCGRQPPGRYQEVVETVRSVELPLKPLKAVLDKDIRFLHYLLDVMSQRLTISMHIRSDINSAEAALLAHMRWRCPDHTITGVEETAFYLNYSRRQMQRVLKSLTQRGVLERLGKGRYRLTAI